MSVENVIEHLKKYNMEDKVMKLEHCGATVEMAAQTLGIEGKRIAKTISLDTNEGPILIVMSGDAKIDNKKYRDEFGQKAKMIKFDEVEEKIGHLPGGVCPFGIKENVRVYFDESIRRFESVFPAAGHPDYAMEISLIDFENVVNLEKWIDVAKLAE